MIVGAILLSQELLRPVELRQLYAVGKSRAVVMGPAEMVAPSFINRLVWSEDGSTLYLERLVVPKNVDADRLALARFSGEAKGFVELGAQRQILAWSRKSGTVRSVLELSPNQFEIESLSTLGASDRLVLNLNESTVGADGKVVRRSRVLMVGSGLARPITLATAPDWSRLGVETWRRSAMGTILIVSNDRQQEKTLYFGPNGIIGGPFSHTRNLHYGFGPDGIPAAYIAEQLPTGIYKTTRRAVNLVTGELGREISSVSQTAPVEPSMQLVPGSNRLHLQLSDTEQESDMGIVAEAAEFGELSPKDDAVAFVHAQNAFVRLLKPLDRAKYDATAREAEKERAMRYARQAGLAMKMYEADFDDVPYGGSNLVQDVGPYVRDLDILRSFNYTPGGLDGQLGHVGGPGGRAVVYQDGRVVWFPDGV